MFQNILLPTDGSDYSKTALEYGIYIAKQFDARLTGLHVIDIKVLQGPVLNDICSSASLSPLRNFSPSSKRPSGPEPTTSCANSGSAARRKGSSPR